MKQLYSHLAVHDQIIARTHATKPHPSIAPLHRGQRLHAGRDLNRPGGMSGRWSLQPYITKRVELQSLQAHGAELAMA